MSFHDELTAFNEARPEQAATLAEVTAKVWPEGEVPSNDTVAFDEHVEALSDLREAATKTALIFHYEDPATAGLATVVIHLVDALREARVALEAREG